MECADEKFLSTFYRCYNNSLPSCILLSQAILASSDFIADELLYCRLLRL